MHWLRRHCENGRLVVTVGVTFEGASGYGITLVEREGIGIASSRRFATRQVAKDAADELVQLRYGHACGPSCGEWMEDRRSPVR